MVSDHCLFQNETIILINTYMYMFSKKPAVFVFGNINSRGVFVP